MLVKDYTEKKVSNENLIKNITVKQSNTSPLTDGEKQLLTNLLCKHKELKVKLENANKENWHYSKIVNSVVYAHVKQVDNILEAFTVQASKQT